MKDCEGTTMMLDVAEVEQIVDKLERGEEVGGHYTELHYVSSAILSNTAAINESVTNLQAFQTFMNELIQSNDQLLLSERLMLKIIRLKFELETCLKSLRCSWGSEGQFS